MADLASRIISRYKADTSDHKRKIKDLKGEEKKRVKASLDGMDKENARLERQVKRWGAVIGAVAGVTAAVVVLRKGYEVFKKNSQLALAAQGASIEGLRSATMGLVDDTRLLEFAVKAQNSTFGLTQVETEKVLQGALALRRVTGVELPEAMDKVQKAITQANAEALKPLGIVIKETSGTASAQEAIIGALSDKYKELGGDVALATDEVDRSGTTFANSLDTLQHNLGEVAVALEPVVALLANAAQFYANILNADSDGAKSRQEIINRAASRIRELERENIRLEAQGNLGQINLNNRVIQSQRDLIAGQQQSAQAEGLALKDPNATGSADRLRTQSKLDRERRARNSKGPSAADIAKKEIDEIDKALASVVAIEDEAVAGRLEAYNQNVEKIRDNAQIQVVELQNAFLGLAGAQESIQETQFLLEQEQQSRIDAVGEVTGSFLEAPDFSAHSAGVAALQVGYQGLSEAAVGAYDAIVTGNMSASEAAKLAIKAVIQGLGREMTIKAVQYTAQGIAALALGPVGGASAGAYFKAAAVMAGGAALAGAASASIGGGGGGGGAPAPATTGLDSGTGAESSRQTTVFLLGESFVEKPARQRVAEFRRAGRKAGISFDGDAVLRS